MNGGAIEFTSQGSFLSGNACWHKLCGLQALHPIAGTAEPVSFARDADSRFASRQMLSRFVPAVLLVFAYCALIYEWGSGAICQPSFLAAYALPYSAHRTHFLPALPHFYAPVKGVWGPAPMVKNGPCPSTPECRNSETCHPRPRRWQSVCQLANALPASACRANFLFALSSLYFQ